VYYALARFRRAQRIAQIDESQLPIRTFGAGRHAERAHERAIVQAKERFAPGEAVGERALELAGKCARGERPWPRTERPILDIERRLRTRPERPGSHHGDRDDEEQRCDRVAPSMRRRSRRRNAG
jgi:hypothetical protein